MRAVVGRAAVPGVNIDACTIRNTAKPQANESTMNIGASTADW